MSLLSWFSSWFHKQEKSIQKIFGRIDGLLHKAEPIVKELAAGLQAASAIKGGLLDRSGVLDAAKSFLTKYIPDVDKVEKAIDAIKDAPLGDIISNTASLVVSFTGHSNVQALIDEVSSDVKLAVNAALSVAKDQGLAPAPIVKEGVPVAVPSGSGNVHVAEVPVVPATDPSNL